MATSQDLVADIKESIEIVANGNTGRHVVADAKGGLGITTNEN